MSEIQEYKYHSTSDFDILFKKFEIEKMKLETQILMESVSLDADTLFCEDEAIDLLGSSKASNHTKIQSNSAQSGKVTSKITSMYNWICKLIDDILEMISNIFSKNSHLDTKTYLASSTGQITLNNDLARVQKEVNAEVREGRKLIQAISSKTGVSDEVVEDYVDRVSKGITQHGKTVVQTAHAYTMYLKSSNGLESMKQELKNAANAISVLANSPINSIQRRGQATRVYKAMMAIGGECISFYNMSLNNIQKRD